MTGVPAQPEMLSSKQAENAKQHRCQERQAQDEAVKWASLVEQGRGSRPEARYHRHLYAGPKVDAKRPEANVALIGHNNIDINIRQPLLRPPSCGDDRLICLFVLSCF